MERSERFVSPTVEKGESTYFMKKELMQAGTSLRIRRDGVQLAKVTFSDGRFYLSSKDPDMDTILKEADGRGLRESKTERIGLCSVFLTGSSIRVLNVNSDFPVSVTLERNEITEMPEGFTGDADTMDAPLPQIEEPRENTRALLMKALASLRGLVS